MKRKLMVLMACLLGAICCITAFSKNDLKGVKTQEIKNISTDSLSAILKKSIAPMVSPNNVWVRYENGKTTVSQVNDKTQSEYIDKNVARYLKGDTLLITTKDKGRANSYLIYKTTE